MDQKTLRVILAEGPVPFEFHGQTFLGAGTTVTEDRVHGAYLAADGLVKTGHGHVLGTYRVTSRWRTPRSWVSSTRCQVRAVVQGRTYNGQSWGTGMLFNGRRVAAELRGLHA